MFSIYGHYKHIEHTESLHTKYNKNICTYTESGGTVE